MLWTAEGFIKPRDSKTVEDTAEECIEELIERSLFLVKKKNRYNSKIKYFSIHDVLREVSMKKAKEEKFLRQNSTSTIQNATNDQHKVSFLKNDLNFHSNTYNAHLRSLKCTIPTSEALLVKRYRAIYPLHDSTFTVLCKTTSLRYLHVVLAHHDKRHATFPKLISRLQNLETFITIHKYHESSTIIPLDIWKLQRLRHIVVASGCNLQFPVASVRRYPILESLQTLIGVRNVNFSMDVIQKIPNVKRMKLLYECHFKIHHIFKKQLFSLSNLQHLHQLEELAVMCDILSSNVISYLAFPRSLKELTLYSTEVPSVNFISVIGSLPNLEILKLKLCYFIGFIWEPVEGEFLRLKYLKMRDLIIKEWRVESFHFPCLKKLKIMCCHYLKEVPECIGEIDTLEELVLRDCYKAKESVQKIQENQQAFGNDSLKITIFDL